MNKGINKIRQKTLENFRKELMLFKLDDNKTHKDRQRLSWLFYQLPKKERKEYLSEFRKIYNAD